MHAQHRYRFLEPDNNHIGGQGCRHLAKANWHALLSLYLRTPPKSGNNSIDALDCVQLAKAQWPALKTLNLCTIKYTRLQQHRR
jgi:hypothetical protein